MMTFCKPTFHISFRCLPITHPLVSASKGVHYFRNHLQLAFSPMSFQPHKKKKDRRKGKGADADNDTDEDVMLKLKKLSVQASDEEDEQGRKSRRPSCSLSLSHRTSSSVLFPPRSCGPQERKQEDQGLPSSVPAAAVANASSSCVKTLCRPSGCQHLRSSQPGDE